MQKSIYPKLLLAFFGLILSTMIKGSPVKNLFSGILIGLVFVLFIQILWDYKNNKKAKKVNNNKTINQNKKNKKRNKKKKK
ncbi:hypothetical protein [Clostridium ganghwense]|uniref:hypothetical protein n=1 Tax=Clostridium ganghwense TaxID=312089 RepID=UPI00227CE18B|nr:hypothetical protein [Clostridium ganghwense]